MLRGRPYLKYLVIPTPWVLGAIFLSVAAHKSYEVSTREQITTGTILLHEPENHNRFGYRFQVYGRVYTGWEYQLRIEPKIGQSVTVYYDPLDPAENALTDYSERSKEALGQPLPYRS